MDEAQLNTLVMLANICSLESLQAGFKEKAAMIGEIKAGRVNVNKGDNGECFNSCLFGSVDIEVQPRGSSVYLLVSSYAALGASSWTSKYSFKLTCSD